MENSVQLDARGGISKENLTRVETVMAVVRSRIADRSLGMGARLPSIRAMVESLGVSKSTVVEAYDRLSAEGAITSRHGAGFYVAGRTLSFSSVQALARPDRDVDPLWMTRHSLEADATGLRPGCGWLPDEWLPEDALRASLRQLARDKAANLVNYGPPLGHLPLRQVLSRQLVERGIEVDAGQIMLCNSATSGIDLVCRLLLQPGDSVLVDDPGYFNFLAMLRVFQVNVVGVPFTASGPDLGKFEAAIIKHRPRLYLTNATLHNPTGASITLNVAYRLLKLAEKHDLMIIEDDIFADFEVEPTPRLAALDGLNHVVYVGGFSKTLSASLRCGFLAIRQDLVEPLIEMKLSTQSGGGPAAADLVHRAFTNGFYKRHMASLRAKLGTSMGLTMRNLKRAGLTPWIEPRGGMFVWAKLPDQMRASNVARAALKHGMLLAPGDAFSTTDAGNEYLRFNVSQSVDPQIFSILKVALKGS